MFARNHQIRSRLDEDLCLGVHGDTITPDTKLETQACDSRNAQKWSMDHGSRRVNGASGLCAQRDPTDGLMKMQVCSKSKLQKVKYTGDRTLKFQNTCVDVDRKSVV